jgi:hypothetical protein
MITRAKVPMLIAISTTTVLLCLATILPVATVATAFAQILEDHANTRIIFGDGIRGTRPSVGSETTQHFVLDLTTLPIIVYKPDEDNDTLIKFGDEIRGRIIIGPGPIPATDVFLKLGDTRGE